MPKKSQINKYSDILQSLPIYAKWLTEPLLLGEEKVSYMSVPFIHPIQKL